MKNHEIDLEPLSINGCWQGRRFKTERYKQWIKLGLWMVKGIEKQEKPYNIEIDFYMSKLMDIDNPVKGFLDLLKKANIIEDDRYIETLHIRKIVSKDKRIVVRFL